MLFILIENISLDRRRKGKMEKGESSLKLLAFFFITAIVATGFAAVAFADSTTIYVPDDYAKIQWAVDNANSGDTIIIRDGVYVENVYVSKAFLTIRSENGSENCTVKASDPAYHSFEITADHVNISGLTVTGAIACVPPWPAGIHLEGAEYCNISNNKVMYNHDGIELDFSANNTIKNNNVSFNRENGIEIDPISNNTLIENNTIFGGRCELFLYGSFNNTLINNTILDHRGAFGVYGYEIYHFIHNIDTSNTVNGKPIYYWVGKQNQQVPSDACYVGIINSRNITVKELTLANNSEGVLLVNSTDSNINTLNILYNHAGILLYFSSNNSIYLSNFITNSRCGILLNLSLNNNIYLNNFINNTYNVCSIRSTNDWNSTKPINYTYNDSQYTNYLGNYWDDYTGSDADGNGIGDTPYIINSDNKDNYPLMKPFESYIIYPTISIYTDKTNYTTGDMMHVGLKVTNPGAAQAVSARIGVEKPDGSTVLFVNPPSVTLPAGLDYSNPDFRGFTLQAIPAGTYTWHVILADPLTGEIICEDTASLVFVPTEVPTEDITGALELKGHDFVFPTEGDDKK